MRITLQILITWFQTHRSTIDDDIQKSCHWEHGKKRIIFISFYMYLKDEEEGTGTLTGHDKRKQCAACFALSLALCLSLSVSCISSFSTTRGCRLLRLWPTCRKSHVVCFVCCCCCFPCYSYNMLEANTGEAKQQIVYNYLQVVFLSL